MATECLFCDHEGGEIIWRDSRCRVVLTDEPLLGFCRVIWNDHIRELTDLATPDRDHLMQVVYAVEAALRARLAPTKMNVASLGNATPHVHWHVIPRFSDDAYFPQPVWAAPQREGVQRAAPDDLVTGLASALAATLGEPSAHLRSAAHHD